MPPSLLENSPGDAVVPQNELVEVDDKNPVLVTPSRSSSPLHGLDRWSCSSSPTFESLDDADIPKLSLGDRLRSDASASSMLKPLTNLIESDLLAPLSNLSHAAHAPDSNRSSPLHQVNSPGGLGTIHLREEDAPPDSAESREGVGEGEGDLDAVPSSADAPLVRLLDALDDDRHDAFSSSSSSSSESSYGSEEEEESLAPSVWEDDADIQSLLARTRRKFAARLKKLRSLADGDEAYESYLLRNELRVQEELLRKIADRLEVLGDTEEDARLLVYRGKPPRAPASTDTFGLGFARHHTLRAATNMVVYCIAHISVYTIMYVFYRELSRPLERYSWQLQWAVSDLYMIAFLLILRMCGTLFEFLSDDKYAGYKFDYLNRLRLGSSTGSIHRWFKKHPNVRQITNIVAVYMVYIWVSELNQMIFSEAYNRTRRLMVRAFGFAMPSYAYEQANLPAPPAAPSFADHFHCDFTTTCCTHGLYADVRAQVERQAALEAAPDVHHFNFLENEEDTFPLVAFTFVFYSAVAVGTLGYMKNAKLKFW